MDESTSETPASASSLEGKSVGLRRSSKCEFLPPSDNVPSRGQQLPTCTVNSVGRVLLPPSEAPDGLPESFEAESDSPPPWPHRTPPRPEFLPPGPSGLRLAWPLPAGTSVSTAPGVPQANMVRYPIGLLLQPDGIPYFRCPPPGSGVAATTGTRDLASHNFELHAASTMEAENMVHPDSMSPASLGICEKLFRRWELKTSLTEGFGQTFPTDPHNTLWVCQGTNNSKRPIPNLKAQGSDPLSFTGVNSNTWRLSWGAISKQAHTSSPPLTLGNSRVVEGPAPLKELGSRAQAAMCVEVSPTISSRYLSTSRTSSGSFPPSEVTFHVPIARVLVQGLGRRGPPPRLLPKPHCTGPSWTFLRVTNDGGIVIVNDGVCAEHGYSVMCEQRVQIGVGSAMNQCEETEEGVPPSKTTLCGEHDGQTKAQRPEQQRPDSPEPEPSCVSIKSHRSMGQPLEFKEQLPSETHCVSMKSDLSMFEPDNFSNGHHSAKEKVQEVTGGQSVQQHQIKLDSVFKHLEENIVTFVKNELKKFQKVLSPDYPECLERLSEDEMVDGTVAAVCRHQLKSNLKKKFQCVFEGIAKAGNPTLLNQIYTELYITEGGTAEVNDEHEFFTETETKEAGICRFEEFQVVFIFDGLDECRLPLDFHNNEILTDVTESTSVDVLLTNLIRGKLLPSARLWITTRPAAANQIPPECVDMVTEVRGFTDPQKEEYFRKRFRDEEQASTIISHIKTSRSLHIMCHIPVFCWITATVLEDVLKTREGGELPKTLTEMYIHFLVVQSKVKNIKYDGGAETDPHWNKQSRKMIVSLGKLAFEQLQKGNLIFYESDLTECGIDIRAASVYSGVFTQIFKEERGLYQDKVFCFIHLSVQEFLAALHVHLTFIKSGVNELSEERSTSLWSKVFRDKPEPIDFYQLAVDKALQSPNGHLDLFLRFLLGLSVQTNQTLLRGLVTHTGSVSQANEETVKYIKERISENLSPERNINLFHCLNELNDRSLVEEIQQVP
ncbi:hypothetical protein L3Q82_005542 [Scortum barcoo]|uniref:Uncharacterized protein n=1 Tax=Scortum barcoo TaxID=214431 RepID=A0ACB8VAD3_9TELE|nr:hypothetical protein L3Q82_005542 [Scortum barcoo]